MGKHILKADFEYDFDLIGISCHVRDYRLAWFLNQALGIGLEMNEEPIEIAQKSAKGHSTHNLFSFTDPDNDIIYHLLANNSAQGYVMQELSQFDFLFVLFENAVFEPDELVEKIREIPVVLLAYGIDPEDLRHKQNLLILQ